MNKLVIGMAVMVIAASAPIAAFAQAAKDLVGIWTLVSAITERDGTKSDIFGPTARGALVFDTSGHYTITFVSSDLPKFAANNRAAGTAEENKAVVTGSLAISGPTPSTRRGRASHSRSNPRPIPIGPIRRRSALSLLPERSLRTLIPTRRPADGPRSFGDA